MCEGWDFRRGFSIKGARHKIDLKITRKTRGLFAKRPYLQPPDRNTDSSFFSRTRTRTGASNPQGSGRVGARVRCKTERGDRKGVLTGVETEVGGRNSKVNAGLAARLSSSRAAVQLARRAAAAQGGSGRAETREGARLRLYRRGPPGVARTPRAAAACRGGRGL
jgi:glucose-6-phosphate dehydrogenase assembly protein OpcA